MHPCRGPARLDPLLPCGRPGDGGRVEQCGAGQLAHGPAAPGRRAAAGPRLGVAAAHVAACGGPPPAVHQPRGRGGHAPCAAAQQVRPLGAGLRAGWGPRAHPAVGQGRTAGRGSWLRRRAEPDVRPAGTRSCRRRPRPQRPRACWRPCAARRRRAGPARCPPWPAPLSPRGSLRAVALPQVPPRTTGCTAAPAAATRGARSARGRCSWARS
jgi:hypothetical protein